jgi:hypothetical protein
MVEKYRRADYPDRELEACHRILMEVVNLLSEFSDHIALVGGWVPYYIVPQAGDPHVGSIDVDVAFDFRYITADTYETILKILLKNGYYQTNKHKPFQWWKNIKVDEGDPMSVEVDLLAPEYGGRGKRHEHQHIQDTKARKARGSDLVFDESHHFLEVILEGSLPNGALDSVCCKVAGVVPFLVMKGMAIGRGKTKDAYDIEYVIRNYAGGLDALIAEFKRDLHNTLVQEGLGKIRTKFETPNHAGPDDVATFLEIDVPENRAIRKRQAYETVSALLDALGIKKFM